VEKRENQPRHPLLGPRRPLVPSGAHPYTKAPVTQANVIVGAAQPPASVCQSDGYLIENGVDANQD